MNNKLEEALAEILAEPAPTSYCWAQDLEEEALDFLKTLEEVELSGKRVRRQVAADKMNELFTVPREITQGMISNHMLRHCKCNQDRDYGWPPEKK